MAGKKAENTRKRTEKLIRNRLVPCSKYSLYGVSQRESVMGEICEIRGFAAPIS